VFHLGQPVNFRDGSAALRIALGGELIVRVATDRRLGDGLDERLQWLRGQLTRLRQKIEIVAADYGRSANAGATAPLISPSV